MKRNLFEELKTYGESDFYPFHMPGHKRNPDSGFLPEMYKIDITEIDGFDNLHHAEGIIKNAQEKAASLYHSKETFSGSSKSLSVMRSCCLPWVFVFSTVGIFFICRRSLVRCRSLR